MYKNTNTSRLKSFSVIFGEIVAYSHFSSKNYRNIWTNLPTILSWFSSFLSFVFIFKKNLVSWTFFDILFRIFKGLNFTNPNMFPIILCLKYNILTPGGRTRELSSISRSQKNNVRCNRTLEHWLSFSYAEEINIIERCFWYDFLWRSPNDGSSI